MGITYDATSGQFSFDFAHDGTTDVVHLAAYGHQVLAFARCFYYGYEFCPEVSSAVREAFIKRLKFGNDLLHDAELTLMIRRAIDYLHRQINLYNYDLVVTPESHSPVNSYMVRYLYRYAQPCLRHIELVKALPGSLDFDRKSYSETYLEQTLEDGRPRYTASQKEAALAKVEELVAAIRAKDYFSIARDVKKSRFRPYIMGFLRFGSEQDRELCQLIRHQNVLVLDDVTTSGSTLGEVLRTLRLLNEDNEIRLFSLIGRKDLMAEY